MQAIMANIQDWVLLMVEQFGYWGIFLMIAVENVFPPIPSEVILAFGGFMTTRTSMKIPGVVLFSTAGALFGALILYWLGWMLGKLKFEKLVEKYGRIVRLQMSDINKAYGWFEKYESKTVFFCRMVPLIRSLISIPAGMSRMRLLPFVLLTTAGSLIWNTILVVAGAMLGEAWESIMRFFDVYSTATYLSLAFMAIGFVLLWFHKTKNRSKE